MLTIFGIKNCDTIKKTKRYFDDKGIEYQFHDYRTDGLEKNWMDNTLAQLDWEKVLNKRGTTYRKLSEVQKQHITAENVAELLVEHPAMIKRPIIQTDDQMILGFSAKQLDEVFS